MKRHPGLSREQLQLLAKLVAERAPELKELLPKLGRVPLTQNEREALRDVLLYEFCAHGLGPDSEPNQYGVFLDDIIGALGDL